MNIWYNGKKKCAANTVKHTRLHRIRKKRVLYIDLNPGIDNMFGCYDSVLCSTEGESPLDQAAEQKHPLAGNIHHYNKLILKERTQFSETKSTSIHKRKM